MTHGTARARFRAELESLAQTHIPHVHSILPVDDGFQFTFSHPSLDDSSGIRILVEPQDRTFLAYTISDVPVLVAKELEKTMFRAQDMRVGAMLRDLSRRLQICLNDTESQDSVMTDVDDEDNATPLGDYDDEDEYLGFDVKDENLIFGLPEESRYETLQNPAVQPDRRAIERMKRDLQTLRQAGFKVAKLLGGDEAADHAIFSASVRVDKLGLSLETREAWNLEPQYYIVLLLRYQGNQYISFEEAIERPAGAFNADFRLRKCSKHKPTVIQAVSAFTPEALKRPTLQSDTSPDEQIPDFAFMGIGESIDNFLNEDFVHLLKIRVRDRKTWNEAVKTLTIMKSNPGVSVPADQHGDPPLGRLPALLSDEHLLHAGEISLPLVAVQCALRYFVRCANYCMVCHQLMENAGSALKPYVCDRPLCLFQYMSMGFGPSVEHEIEHQPQVVDLLIQFCCYSLYSETSWGPSPWIAGVSRGPKSGVRLRNFPTGLGLMVPNIKTISPQLSSARRKPSTVDQTLDQLTPSIRMNEMEFPDPIHVKFDHEASCLELSNIKDAARLRSQQWIAVAVRQISPNPQSESHATDNISTALTSSYDTSHRRVTGQGTRTPESSSMTEEWASMIIYHCCIRMIVGSRVELRVASRTTLPFAGPEAEDNVSGLQPGILALYDQSLDDIQQVKDKAFSMSLLLSTLPSVKEMRLFLQQHPHRPLALFDKILPPAASLLRWIVASNRSFIVQVDENKSFDDTRSTKLKQRVSRDDEKLRDIEGWVQFRFAQGSPEKEAKFQQAMAEVQKPHSSILAWHGSPVGNWHSIIREGLDYSIVESGRSYGNGVYFAKDFSTSSGYARSASSSPYFPTWRKSCLQINSAISLVELVNQPELFISKSPYYVVQHCHWIQCRYLLVKPLTESQPQETSPSGISQEAFAQDPKYQILGPKGQIMNVPKKAIPSLTEEKNWATSFSSSDGKGQTSESDDEEDDKFLKSDNITQESIKSDPKPSVSSQTPLQYSHQASDTRPPTGFRPGSLDFSTLPQLKPPSFATDTARKTIGREVKKLQEIQSATPSHELGWYIDFDRMENMFQWIVELHSFDANLPLTKDMEKIGMPSIVLEMRFGKDYPMSPPFVRVVRPRFRLFAAGGGGHVTAGGAMCMQLLTSSGWTPANSLESVLLQVRMALSSTDPSPARIDATPGIAKGSWDYGIAEAVEAYTRAARVHNWTVPRDLLEFINGS